MAAPRRASARIRARPARRRPPAPGSGASRLHDRSGCQPRRHSSPAVGFWVQRTGTPSCQLEMQMLQPMHSRISSLAALARSCCGRKGSAIEGRAAPMKSRMPRLICDTIVSGEVKRPTPTTGLLVSFLTKSITGSWLPSAVKREAEQSVGLESIFTSKRSGRPRSAARSLHAPRTRHACRACRAAPPG